jgi:branched-chain amino acid aminotransferase
MEFTQVTRGNVFDRVDQVPKPWQANYLAMYSSQWKGYTVDPALMTVPVDDHLVHRGDGVFDTMRCVGGRLYQMEAHLERLEKSASAISLPFPPAYDRVREIIGALVVRGGQRNCVIRIVLSRGPGSFSTNPFDCPESQLYVTVLRYKAVPDEVIKNGTCVITSSIPTKRSFFARIKSCNYLPNVLMKMEALKAGCPYAVALDTEGYLTEGSTENVGILSEDGVLKFPGFERTLAGTTVQRVWALAETRMGKEHVSDVRFDRIRPEEACKAREVMLMGTSINVVPVVRFDGNPVGTGLPGPVGLELCRLLQQDMQENRELLTELEWPENAEGASTGAA